ncbi:MAG: hypothetical protein ACF8XB_21155 [Planctomycetota bacterium JB042]
MLRAGITLLRRRRLPRRAVVGVPILAVLAVLEWLGRSTASDVADALAFLAIGFVTAIWLSLDRDARRGAAERARAFGRRLKRLAPELGADLRGRPPWTPGWPPAARACALAFALLSAAVVGWAACADRPFREVAIHGTYVGWVVLLGALWAVLVAASIALPWLAHELLLEHLRDRGRGRVPGETRRRVAAGVVLLPLLLAVALPVGVAVALPFVAGAAFLVAARASTWPDAVLLWRDAAGRRGSFPLVSWVAAQLVAVWWGGGLVLLMATGGRAFGAPSSGLTPITDGLGLVASWLAGPAMLLTSGVVLAKLREARRFDPATPCPTSVHVTPAYDVDDARREAVDGRFAERGFRVRWAPASSRVEDVPVRLVERVDPRRERTWPRDVSARSLEVPEQLDVLARRDVVQRRRELLSGLGVMVGRAREREFTRGCGLWIAPHLWYVLGICRDTAEAEPEEGTGTVDGVIGLPYHVVLPRAARSHAYELLRCVEVDLIFLEDGVPWSAARTILRALFRHHDLRRARVEATDLPTVPGVRVLVDEHELGGTWGHERYPEPDYDEIAQARVLLLFVDRGGDDEEAPSPTADEDLLIGV